MLTIKQTNALGNIVNSSWGSSSNDTYNCKVSMDGDQIKMMYSTMAYFASEAAMSTQTRRLAEESNDRIVGFVDAVKSQFKETTGSGLKLEKVGDKDTLELVDASSNSPRRVCVFRRNVIFEISN
jgi:hypothetical protein